MDATTRKMLRDAGLVTPPGNSSEDEEGKEESDEIYDERLANPSS